MKRGHIVYRIMLYYFNVGRRRQSGCYNIEYKVHIAYISIRQMKTLKLFFTSSFSANSFSTSLSFFSIIPDTPDTVHDSNPC